MNEIVFKESDYNINKNIRWYISVKLNKIILIFIFNYK
jgi:hypothetical protein